MKPRGLFLLKNCYYSYQIRRLHRKVPFGTIGDDKKICLIFDFVSFLELSIWVVVRYRRGDFTW